MNPHDDMREIAREVLRELIPEMVAATQPGQNGHKAEDAAEAEIVPVVPAPPVAAVLRPSTWATPPAPGEVIGAGTDEDDTNVEVVTIDDDADLDRFVRDLVTRLESPRDRLAIRAGRLRFTLDRAGRPPVSGPDTTKNATTIGTIRIAKGAVTERTVREAAEKNARLVLARGAVLTPLARDQVRALGVAIEREGRC